MSTGPTRHSSALRRCAKAIAGVSLALALPASAYAAPVRLVIDPGHGGKDPGAMSGGVREKDTNLQISRAVAKEARRQGWDVELTRNEDKFIPLAKRPAKANSERADAFLSIHSNSVGKSPKGNMTIYRSKQGKRLGRAIMGEMDKLTEYKDIGNHKDSRGLAVLRASKRPAVVVEVLSVSVSKERKQIKDPKMQKKYAEAIVRGVAKYKGVDYEEPETPKKKAAEMKAPAILNTPASTQPLIPPTGRDALNASETSSTAPLTLLPQLFGLLR